MPAHTGHEKQINSSSLVYSTIYKDRTPPFLQRNLTQALNEHQESQAQRDAVPTTRSWKPPNDELTTVIAARHGTCELRIHPEFIIKPPHYSSSNITNPSLVFTTRCLLTFSIYRRDAQDPWRHKFRDWSHATFKAYQDGTAVVSMRQSLTIASHVFPALDMEYNGGGTLHGHVGPKYVLRIELQCEHPSHNQAVFDFVGFSGQRNYANGQHLRSYVYSLPRCPASDKCLPLKLDDGRDRLVSSEHTLYVNMEWAVPRMTIMEELNLMNRLERGMTPLSATTTTTTTQPTELLRMTYRCDQVGLQKSLVLQGCLCPFCCMRDFRTVERLRLHLKLEHDRFHFAFNEFRPLRRAAPKEVHVKLTFKERAEKPNSDGGKEIRWIAPSHPFDLDAFLAGDESWLRGRKPKASLAAITAGSQRRKKPDEVEHLPKLARKRYKVPRIREEGTNLKLFTMHSRRPLEEGEEISEDDDSLFPSWIVSKIRRRSPTLPQDVVTFMDRWDAHMLGEPIKSDLVVGDAVVRFLRSNEKWIRETPGMAREFMKKLNELVEDDLVSTEVYDYGRDRVEFSAATVINGEKGEKRERDDNVKDVGSFCRPSSPKKTKMDGSVQANQGKENTPWKVPSLSGGQGGPGSNPLAKNSILQTQSKQRDNRLGETANSTTIDGGADVCACFCGKPITALDAPRAIICANMACIREEFHLSCVGLDKRVAGWRCDDCAAQGAR
ncbi:hypothetical protein IWX49DRAFT_590968 [Phyllosticta citricarpa]|uniref:C2H2-type domain-containing protein n=1 Tax=Phyllosticta citricarpa TaxID=55181 RepID=A0ABR1LEB3_9PEZI